MAINFFFPKKETTIKDVEILKNLDSLEKSINSINLYEYKLYEISKKTDSLITLSNKIKFENEKTNAVMLKQDTNFKNIDSLIQEEIDIINQLSIDIHNYKTILDENIEHFKSNKEKLLTIVNFIKEIKNYIFNLKDSSNSMLENSNNILHISQTIKKISEHSKALSVNAQIESAKISGNHVGFNVLSDEMVKMADNTKENSILIDKTINIIINDINHLNNDITENVTKIEQSIVLCNIVVDFVEALNNEYLSNIMMFDRILNSMNEMILFIENIKKSMQESYYTSEGIFKSTSSEYICIEGLIEESSICKDRIDLVKTKYLNSFNSLPDETLKVLIDYCRDFFTDPLEIAYDSEKMISQNIFNTLFTESKLGTPIPSLAKGWTDEDSKIWTIYLKNDIYFSNGEPVTAEDVEFSIIRTFVENPFSQPYVLENIEGHRILKPTENVTKEKISGIEIINDKIIRFKLKNEDVLFPSKLSFSMCSIVSKKEFIKTKKYIGTGAYYVKSIIKKSNDTSLLYLEANPYNKFAYPYIKNIEIVMTKKFKYIIQDLINNPTNNTYDMIYPISYTHINQLKNLKDTLMYNILSAHSYSTLFVNFIGISKNNLIKSKDFRQSVFSILNNMDLTLDDIDDYYIKNNTISNRWFDSKETPPKWLDDKPIITKFNDDSVLNILTYPNRLTEAVCEKIQNALAEKGLKSKLHIIDEYNNLEEYDLSVGVFTIDTYNLYSQLYDSMSAPYGSCVIDEDLGLELKASDKISNYKTKNSKLQELEIKILKEYYNLPICYVKSYLLQQKNIVNLNSESITSIKFDNILKKSSK